MKKQKMDSSDDESIKDLKKENGNNEEKKSE